MGRDPGRNFAGQDKWSPRSAQPVWRGLPGFCAESCGRPHPPRTGPRDPRTLAPPRQLRPDLFRPSRGHAGRSRPRSARLCRRRTGASPRSRRAHDLDAQLASRQPERARPAQELHARAARTRSGARLAPDAAGILQRNGPIQSRSVAPGAPRGRRPRAAPTAPARSRSRRARGMVPQKPAKF